jgi:hypothetical protein
MELLPRLTDGGVICWSVAPIDGSVIVIPSTAPPMMCVDETIMFAGGITVAGASFMPMAEMPEAIATHGTSSGTLSVSSTHHGRRRTWYHCK